MTQDEFRAAMNAANRENRLLWLTDGLVSGIALGYDRTSAPWFQEAFPKADLVMFTPKIRFLRPDGTEGASPSNGSAFFAVGEQGVAALKRAGLGFLATPTPRKALT